MLDNPLILTDGYSYLRVYDINEAGRELAMIELDHTPHMERPSMYFYITESSARLIIAELQKMLDR